MTRESIAKNLADLITNLGGVPEGRSTAELLDQLEGLVKAGESDIVAADVTDDDIDQIFD